MKSAVTFVLVLFSFLLGGPGYAAPAVPATAAVSSQEMVQQFLTPDFIATADHSVFTTGSLAEQAEYFSFTEDDDQDESHEDLSSTRAFTPFCHILISRDQYALSCPLFMSGRNDFSRNARIIILQRVLRI